MMGRKTTLMLVWCSVGIAHIDVAAPRQMQGPSDGRPACPSEIHRGRSSENILAAVIWQICRRHRTMSSEQIAIRLWGPAL